MTGARRPSWGSKKISYVAVDIQKHAYLALLACMVYRAVLERLGLRILWKLTSRLHAVKICYDFML
jgi:hypothetical protein